MLGEFHSNLLFSIKNRISYSQGPRDTGTGSIPSAPCPDAAATHILPAHNMGGFGGVIMAHDRRREGTRWACRAGIPNLPHRMHGAFCTPPTLRQTRPTNRYEAAPRLSPGSTLRHSPLIVISLTEREGVETTPGVA